MKSKEIQRIVHPPDAIIVTLPARFFEEQNHAAYLAELQNCNEGNVWYRVCKNLPIHDVLYVYTIIENKIHHRANFVGLERNKTYRFPRPDGHSRTFENANAILTSGPVVFAPEQILMKGFQGFRYSPKIF